MCDGEDKLAPLERLLEFIERFVVVPAGEVTPFALGERLIRLRHGIDLLELRFAREAAAFASTDEAVAQGSTSTIDWIRHQCRMSGNAAARSVATGEEADHLPASVAALEDGLIGFAHLALLAGTERALTPAGTFDEGALLGLAVDHSVGRFAFDCTHARHAADAAAVLDEHVTAVECRRLDLTRYEDGRVGIHGVLDPVGGATLRVALAPLCVRSGAGDERSRSRRWADGLVELAGHALDHGFTSERGVRRTHLQLTASVETVMGLAGAPGGDLEFAGVVPAATVQRLACDASIRRVLLGPDSAVIDVGRALRVPSGAGRAALRVRDQGCVWPGCDRPSSWTNAHHVLHWGHGGDTNLKNLVLLCYRHHWSVHEGGWQLVRADDRGMLAIPPSHDHRTLPRAPDGTFAA
ncbi:MAG: HNH endonuclease signature motif containing protein [Candidatus Dormibacteria bacterium]